MAKIIYVWERRTLGLLIITWLRSPMSERRTLVLLIITWLRSSMPERGEP
jgi:hypothetical protein